MKSPVRGQLAAAIGAALIVFALGGVAHAQKMWTEREVELRSMPGDDSQVVKRVGKGKSLEVVKRLGTWVRVKYEGRTGWVRRTALSSEPGDGGGDDAKDEAKPEEEPKPAADGAKRTAAKKKAERKKSRASRHKASARDEEEEEEEEVADEDDGGKGKRPRSTWSARSSVPGGPVKVEIQSLSVQAFSKAGGKGKVVFTLSEGDRVRVIERGENRWLLVENAKQKNGWIPAFTVRDNGLIPDARKDSRELEEEAGEEEEAPVASKGSKSSRDDEDEDADSGEDEGKGKKSKRAAAADDSDDSDEESSSRSSDDDAEAEVGSGAISDEESKKPWTLTGGLHAGFTAVAMDVTPTGADAEAANYNGPIAGLTGEFMYRIRPKIGILAQLDYDWSTALGGLTFQQGANAEISDIKLTTHRVGASAGVAYGKRAVGSLRLGYQYGIFQISDLANEANWPRETTSGPTAGLGFSYAEIAGKLGLRAGVDAMLFGSKSQTAGLQDGPTFDSLTALWASLRVDYPIGKNLIVDGGYRFGYSKATWTGTSERNGASATERKDQAHEISIGAGWRL